MADTDLEPTPSEAASPPGHHRHDELMADPPRGDHHLGRFAGYAAAKGVRRRIAVVLALSAVAAVVAFYQYSAYIEHQKRHPFELPESSSHEHRPRELHWSSGEARLGLSREAPSVEVIHLPDRSVRLAEDCEHAQIHVSVVDGKTESLEVLVGEVVEQPRVDAAAND